MFRNGLLLVVILISFAFSAPEAFGQDTKPKKSITYAEWTAGKERIDGFVPLLYDAENDEMLLEVARLNTEFLYQVSLPTGVGSNFIGLDRGQLGDTHVVSFERAGNKLLLVQPNYGYRALSENAAERKAVEESFAKSVIWGFKILAAEDGKYLVDATDFFLRDAHGVASTLARAKQGVFKMDPSRSAFYKPRTKGFPKNTEIETTITLTSNGPTGRELNQTVPTGNAVTVRQRHSLVELPDADYKPRKFDPRVSAIPMRFYDYATGISENLEKRWILRHRLNKKFSNVEMSEAVEPIVYYVDSGAPPAIRDALIEGASWWNQAFEAAGFKDAFQVKALPADADPMDIRYNVINWVHRSTRGWAYGSSVTDPRTGEIIRGVVTLDSQRARQDFLISTGLAPQYANTANACDFGSMPDIGYLPQSNTDANALSIARIKQLSAHEVGHTLGFSHNFAASTYGRGSVMDYPAPVIKIKDGKLDFSDAYATGIGSFDKFSVRFSYSQFQNGADEKAELKKIVESGLANGMLYISDADTRPAGAAHPLANLWDNGPDPVAELAHEMEVRRIALKSFGLNNLEDGEPLSELENMLLPLFLHHRYQLTAAIKSIGGVYYTYSVRDGSRTMPGRVYEIVDPAQQQKALDAALDTISPEELAIPERILKLVPPQAFGMGSQRTERFPGRSRPVFDPIGAAEISANLTIGGLLEPNRAARLVTFNARDQKYPAFSSVIEALINRVGQTPADENKYHEAIRMAVQSVLAEQLMSLASNEDAQSHVRVIATKGLRSLASELKNNGPARGAARIFRSETASEIERFLERPVMPRKRTEALPDPPSDPIGAE